MEGLSDKVNLSRDVKQCGSWGNSIPSRANNKLKGHQTGRALVPYSWSGERVLMVELQEQDTREHQEMRTESYRRAAHAGSSTRTLPSLH